jgi:hypothetical protein
MPPSSRATAVHLFFPLSLSLYRWLRREASRIPNESLRSYYLTRIRGEFNSHRSERDARTILLLHERAVEQIAFVLGKYLLPQGAGAGAGAGAAGPGGSGPAARPPSAQEIAAAGALLRPSMAAKAQRLASSSSSSSSPSPPSSPSSWQGRGVAPLTPWDLGAVQHELGLDVVDDEGGEYFDDATSVGGNTDLR